MNLSAIKFHKLINPFCWDMNRLRRFYIYIAVGIVITIGLFIFENTHFASPIINYFVDKLIQLDYNKLSNSNKNLEDKIVYIDIDKETDFLWLGDDRNTVNKFLTPRNKVAQLLKIIYDSRPNEIVLDIKFDVASNYPQNDDSLRFFFEQFIFNSRINNNPIKLILPSIITEDNLIGKDIFDSLNLSKDPNVYYGLDYVASDEESRIMRFMVDYKKTADNNIVLSMPIAAVAFYLDIPKSDFDIITLQTAIKDKLGDFELVEDKINSYNIDIIRNRIRYFEKPYYEGSSSNLDVDSLINKNIGFKALYLTDYCNFPPFNSKTFRDSIFYNKIVIIGSSSESKGDIHLTSIGKMAGMYLVGNSILTILNLRLKYIPIVFQFFIELISIIAAAFVFMKFRTQLSEIVVQIVCGIPLLGLGIVFFIYYGYIFHGLFVLFGISIYSTIISFEESYIRRGKNISKHFYQYKERSL
jgi:hypothetical protein